MSFIAASAITPDWLRRATQQTFGFARTWQTIEVGVALFAVAFVSFHLLFP